MCNYRLFKRDFSKIVSASLSADIIIRGHVTERASRVAAQHYVTLIVKSGYNKCDIKKACELLYETDVLSVNVMNKKHKKRRFRGKEFIRSDTKKVMVRFKDDTVIEKVFGGQK